MTRALITINSVTGPSLNASINTSVQLGNSGNGGEATYLWSITDQPPGTADALSSTSSASPTFTPKKEGTYLLSLIVNSSLVDEARGTQIVAVRQFKTGIRIPAAGEVAEAGARGHAQHVNEILQLVDKMRADPFMLVGVASGALTKNDVAHVTGVSTIKGGLPGQEQLPTAAKALATASTISSEPLFVVVGAVDGSSNSVANGGLVLLRAYGVQLATGLSGSAGAPVYVSDAGVLSLSPGTFQRRLGALVTAADALIANDTSGASTGPRTVEDIAGTAYTLTQQDALNKLKTTSASAPKIITVPPDATPIASGTEIPIINTGAGDVEVVGGAGVTVESLYTKQAIQMARILLTKFGSNHWKLSGELKVIPNLTIYPSPIFNPLRGVGTPTITLASAPLVILPASIIAPSAIGTPTIGLNIPATLTISPAGIVSSTKGFGTPQIIGGAATVTRSRMAANVDFVQYYGASQPFLNLVYQAPDWGYGGYTGPLDANGWPSAAITGSPRAGFQCRVPHAGQYVATFLGIGTLVVDFGGSIVSNTSNRYVLQLNGDSSGDGPDRVGIYINTSSAAPNNVRNLVIVPIEHESDWQTVVINPEYRAVAEPFSTLRFMDFFRINNTPRRAEYPATGWDQPDLTQVVTNWSTRTQPTYALQGNTARGPSVELAIDMCNVLNCDFWICIPLNANANWVQGCCALIASRLAANLKVCIEFGNEIWNDAFFNGTDVMTLALAMGFPNTYDTRFGYQTMMGRYMKDQLGAVISPTRVRHIITTQTSFDFRQQITVDMPHSYGLYTDGQLAYQHAWAMCTAPYVGVERGEDPATASDSVATIISKLTTVDTPVIVDDATRSKVIAHARSLKFGAYECGQHLFNSDFDNTAIQTKLTAVNRDTGMYACMLNYLNLMCAQMDEAPIALYTMVGEFSQYGRWGWKEDMDQVVNASPRQCPKYDAAMAWIAANTAAGGTLAIFPASIVGPRAIGTPSLSGGGTTIAPASIVGPRAIGTPTIIGGASSITTARVYITGHSLTQQPIEADLAILAGDLSKTFEGQIQMHPGSTIYARNAGANDPRVDAVPTWNGWGMGQDKDGGTVNAYAELRTHPSFTAAITHLIIAESHYSLTEMRFSETIPAMYQYMEQYRTVNGGKTHLYGTWLWITEAQKAAPTGWITFTRAQSRAWASAASKINDVQSSLGRPDRIKFIPMDSALATLVETVCGAGLAGFTGTNLQKCNIIFDDEHLVYTEGSVHLTAVGAYYAACVLYSAIYGVSPAGAVTVPSGVTSTQATSLQTLAWTFINGYYTTNGANGEYLDSAARLTLMNTFVYDYTTFIGGTTEDGDGYHGVFTDTTNNNPLWSNVAPPDGWWLVAP